MLSWLAKDFKGGNEIAATARMRSGASKVPGLHRGEVCDPSADRPHGVWSRWGIGL